MAKENLVDSYVRLSLDVAGDGQYVKIPHLQKDLTIPAKEKVEDDITASDDTEEVKAMVNFTKNSNMEFTVVYDKEDATHRKLDTIFDDNSYGKFKLEFVNAGYGFTFEGQLMSWSEEVSPGEKKLRKKGTLSVIKKTKVTG